MRANPITSEHIGRMVAAAGRGRNPIRDRALVLLVAETGMRPCEAANLTWRAFTDASGALTGRCRWKTRKGGNWRDLPLSGPLAGAVADLYGRAAGRMDQQDAVFITEQRSRFAEQSMRACLKAIARKAGLRASGYSLRHAAFNDVAGVVVEVGGTARDLTAFSGHKSIDAVGMYMDAHSSIQGAIAEASAMRTKRF